ncbi:acyltransferase family protein [Lysinibacillus xylanilyticus]|uniref:acyltransferase family protein n=1 Tax=Lysinibacillus xylanilyticus TaxID=582475 RepID=UPI003CFDE946
MQNKEHFNWIDVLKGLGIILVILGHIRLSPELINYIYLFHMPLFFFISGYLMNISKYNSMGQLVKKKTRTLLIPYITFSAISIICYSVIGHKDIDVSATVLSIIEGKRNEIYFNVPLWFLVGLFVVEMMYYIQKKLLKNDILLLILAILINYIAVVFLKVIETPNWIWSIDTAMYYLLYYQLGNLFRVYKNKIDFNKMFNKVAVGIFIFLCISFNLLSLVSPDLINYVYNYLDVNNKFLVIRLIAFAISGIVTYVCLAMYIKKSTMLEYIGKNSLIIFALHWPIGIWALDMLKVQMQIQIVHSNALAIIELIIILLILRPIIKIINNNFPIILGRGDFFGTPK